MLETKFLFDIMLGKRKAERNDQEKVKNELSWAKF